MMTIDRSDDQSRPVATVPALSDTSLAGGCACGAVRYRLSAEPYDTGWCHCRLCQKTSAAPALVFTTVPAGTFAVEQGQDDLATFRSTPFGQRQFCRACGTLLTIHVDFQPQEIDIAAATLDEPAAVAPGFHIFTEEAIAWAPIDDGLPRHARFRPDTRGLAAGETYPEGGE